MRARASTFLIFLLCLAASGPARPQTPATPYRLDADASFQEGCFGGCLCPVLVAGLQGGFLLTPMDTLDGFRTWAVSGVDWLVPELGSRLTGSGTYRLREGPQPEQQLTLDLSLDGAPVERYDSGLVPVRVPFPRLDVQVSLFDLRCYDRVLQVRARPAGPVTFRFEGEVTGVFDGLGALGGSVIPGSSFRGSFTFDPDTPNTAPPVDEGEAGLYHHDRPPAGVRLRLESFTFRSVPRQPDFDVIVSNDFGFAGADEFGFVSGNNQARGLASGAPVDRLDIDWLASTITEEPLDSAELPLVPPDLDLLGGGLLTIYGECTLCLAPAAFFRIEGTLTRLETAAAISVDGESLWLDGPADAWGWDVVSGDLTPLRSAAGDFGAAVQACLADDLAGDRLPHAAEPAPGQVLWYVARPLTTGVGTYDAAGLCLAGARDEGIAAHESSCP